MPVAQDSENSPNWITQARTRLALRRAEKPVTKAGQIRALWPEIEAALAIGQSTASICKWLEEDAGITLGVTSLTSYVSQQSTWCCRARAASARASWPVGWLSS